jgi:hypothetical protein
VDKVAGGQGWSKSPGLKTTLGDDSRMEREIRLLSEFGLFGFFPFTSIWSFLNCLTL